MMEETIEFNFYTSWGCDGPKISNDFYKWDCIDEVFIDKSG